MPQQVLVAMAHDPCHLITGPHGTPLTLVLNTVQHNNGDEGDEGGATDDDKDGGYIDKSLETGLKLARGHRKLCLECFAPEGTPIQVSSAPAFSPSPLPSCPCRALVVLTLSTDGFFLEQGVGVSLVRVEAARLIGDAWRR